LREVAEHFVGGRDLAEKSDRELQGQSRRASLPVTSATARKLSAAEWWTGERASV
jgi:hypothetical protein